jgi:serine/threonine protein kinase
MSPEQAEGNHHADRRADVYSLGCVAYEMVVESPVHRADSQAVLARHRSMPAPSARIVRPSSPEWTP